MSTIAKEFAQDIIKGHGYGVAPSAVEALARIALAAMDNEPVAVVEPSDYVTAAQLVGEGPARKAVHELYEGALRIGDKLYRHAQPAPVVQVVSEEPPEHLLPKGNSRDAAYCRGATILGWKLCRATMLQTEPVTTVNKLGYSPVIPAGLIAAVNRLLDSDGSRGCYSAIRCGNAHDEIERLLAAAPQNAKPRSVPAVRRW